MLQGSPVELICTVTGTPSPQLKWSKDGMVLVEDHRASVTALGNGTYSLKISALSSQTEGTYRVVASNDQGSATTKVRYYLRM